MKCNHGMTIYEGPDGKKIYSCSYCSPPEIIDNKIRMSGYKKTFADDFCTEETIELLKNCKCNLRFDIPPWAEGDFTDDYCDCSGEYPNFDDSGIYLRDAKHKYEKQWYSASFEFEWNDNLVFNPEFTDKIKPVSGSKNRVVIHSIHLAGFLLSKGFKPGRN